MEGFKQLTCISILLQLFFNLLPSAIAVSSGPTEGYTINGRVKAEGMGATGFSLAAKKSNAKITLNGGQKVRVDVSARNAGKVQAALTENRKGLSKLVLEPLREEQYYERREPFSIMSIIKSPMGLMVGFMLVVVFLMPKLMENMDPEEIKRTQEEMRSQGVPSLANLLPGAARS
ncbi:ER membrane protein complex subunit 7 homolog isoform X2 [Telopea speciosissima]|uniref:ER membrane protein complex subunit 7 homolog isoform X2 n=1 Tax=Telopea speciosissima TaxID=54955 RepID=UPI001CC42F32|nr:ER membrane protein complex subunit 7 homolog isoform X2 [Telopea speciosissima]